MIFFGHKRFFPPKFIIRTNISEHYYKSQFSLTLQNPYRRYCIKLVELKAFDYFILLTIIANCITLGVQTPYPTGDSDPTNEKVVSYKFYTFKICKINKITKKFQKKYSA